MELNELIKKLEQEGVNYSDIIKRQDLENMFFYLSRIGEKKNKVLNYLDFLIRRLTNIKRERVVLKQGELPSNLNAIINKDEFLSFCYSILEDVATLCFENIEEHRKYYREKRNKAKAEERDVICYKLAIINSLT